MEGQILFEEYAALHRPCLNGPNVLVSLLYVLTVFKLRFGNRSSA